MRGYWLVLVVCLVARTAWASNTHVDDPTGAIERQYFVDGPWAVTTKKRVPCGKGHGFAMDLFYPVNLGAHNFKHPIVTWGNGTDGKPSNVKYFLRHLATWGFVVAASNVQ